MLNNRTRVTLWIDVRLPLFHVSLLIRKNVNVNLPICMPEHGQTSTHRTSSADSISFPQLHGIIIIIIIDRLVCPPCVYLFPWSHIVHCNVMNVV